MSDKDKLIPILNRLTKKPRLITSDGKFIGDLPENVIPLRDKPVPIQDNEGMEWKSAVDLLKELVHDIEAGRLEPPEMIYVAMLTRHPDPGKQDMVGYPSYSWMESPAKRALVAFSGLLNRHMYLMQERGA